MFEQIKGKLGFGCMRLPMNGGNVDTAETSRMVDAFLNAGFNYFDTAHGYLDGKSETALRECLTSRHPRESYILTNKLTTNYFEKQEEIRPLFEKQLEACGVDYFDFYLLHNVCEKSLDTYLDEKWGIVDYFVEQKKLGKIRHLGFSTHARPENLEMFLDKVGEHMEFCQIQLNYLDWTLQDAKQKYEMLTDRGIPVWVMEPLRGGKDAWRSGCAGQRPRAGFPLHCAAAQCKGHPERHERYRTDAGQCQYLCGAQADFRKAL